MFSDVCRIDQKYKDRDLAHDARGIFDLAHDTVVGLIVPNDRHPLALRLARHMVDYHIGLYMAAHQNPA